ncbi:hypothetical protein EG328_002885 [Venturia inaequalis]|uniref:Uncharacterized protein n=1 Tax=Venturia inaequalis TaxID=5025 RepID=A0A8H3USU5_VENIN|nr:hypothetical protein EG328_002885 [Venturia inaequalis]
MSTPDEIISSLIAEIAHLDLSLKIKDTILNSKGLAFQCKEFEESVILERKIETEKDSLIASLQASVADLKEMLKVRELEVKIRVVEVAYAEEGYSFEGRSRKMVERWMDIQRAFEELSDVEEQDRLRILFGQLGKKYRELEEKTMVHVKKAVPSSASLTQAELKADREVVLSAGLTEAQLEADGDFFPDAAIEEQECKDERKMR